MSDGGSSGLSGTFELIGQGAKKGAQNLAGGVGNFAGSAAKQVTGTGGVASGNMSGSFDLKGGAPQSVDLFAPDAKKPAQNPQQVFGNMKPLTETGQKVLGGDRQYTQEELEKIQSIESELRSMHKQINNIEADMEKVRREREETYQKRVEDDAMRNQQKQMTNLQQQEQNGQVDQNVFKAARTAELAKGDVG